MGFISLLLTVFQDCISGICIPTSIANTWHPCDEKSEVKKYSGSYGRTLLEFLDDSTNIPRRSLASKYDKDKCAEKARLPLLFSMHIWQFTLVIEGKTDCYTVDHIGKPFPHADSFFVVKFIKETGI